MMRMIIQREDYVFDTFPLRRSKHRKAGTESAASRDSA